MLKPFICALLTGIAFVSAFVSGAQAHSGHDRTIEGSLAAMVQQAQLVFIGKVARVDYTVEISEVKERIPVTYVTYKIEKTLRGKSEGRQFTMRFLGGPDGQGRFLTVSNTPRFMKGEQDILLVSGNGDKACPLVNCEDGRFRVLEGGVYSAHGVPVRALVEEGVISRGSKRKEFTEFRYPAPSFDQTMKNPEARKILEASGMSAKEARAKFEKEAPTEIVVRSESVQHAKGPENERAADKGDDPGAIPETAEPLQEGPIAVEEFLGRISEISREAAGKLVVLRSIDPKKASPLSFGKESPPRLMSEKREASGEMDEEAMLRERDGNPVLGPKSPVQ